jgi:hypothetical protein
VHVSSTPAGASVREDGVELCAATPCDVAFEPTDTVHALVVSKAGFQPQAVAARAADAHVEAHLAPLPE